MIYDMIHLLTAIGLSPGGSSTVHIYTQTVHRTTQNKQYIEQHKNLGIMRVVPCLCELHPGICLTIEEKSSVLSLTSAIDGVGGQSHPPAALPTVKTRYPLYRRLGGPQGRSGRVRKMLPPTGFDRH